MRASMDVNSTVTWITPQQHTDQNPVSSFPQHDVKFRSPWVLPPQPRGHPQADGPKHDGEPHVPPMHQDQDRGLRVTYPRHQEHHPRQPRSPKSPTSTVFWDAQTCSNQTITWLGSASRNGKRTASEQMSRNGVLLDVKGDFRGTMAHVAEFIEREGAVGAEAEKTENKQIAYGFNYRGTSFDRDKFHEVVHDAEAVVGSISADESIPYLGWIVDWLTGHRARTERVFHEVDTFFQHVIDNHLKPERIKEHDDMVDVLLRIEKEQTELGASQFTKDNIKATLLNLFLGGVDTVSLTVNWAMAELVRNPRVMKKVQDEVRKCVGNKGRVTESDIDQLEYLRMLLFRSRGSDQNTSFEVGDMDAIEPEAHGT
ncbi:hypothetical protein NC652_021940 [Populus alba x Populus x berolinensis]|nr:hypothetical protein NC652_021940 [Populus alba x Populus x berolinensis]